MTYKGHVEKNVVILDEGAIIPDGTLVTIEPVESLKEENASFVGRLGGLVGSIDALPADYSLNHAG